MTISFCVEVWNNFSLADWCLANVRKQYPDASIVAVSDGDENPEYKQLERHGAKVIYGERLWVMGSAGPLWKRRLLNFEKEPADYLIKIDTDTGFYRPLSSMPEQECIFGTLWREEPPFITGGFIGLSRSAAMKVLHSGILDHEILKEFNNPTATPPMNTEDRAMGEIAKRLGIAVVDHAEICSRWKVRFPNPDLRYAVVHPCKDGKL